MPARHAARQFAEFGPTRGRPSWLDRPVSLRRLTGGLIAIARELESPTRGEDDDRGHDPREDRETPFYPEGHAPAWPDRGDAWEPPTGEPTDEDAPTDGRQLLGWSSKQVPDAKGLILSYGRKNGLPSKIVGWSPQQVATEYRFARARSTR